MKMTNGSVQSITTAVRATDAVYHVGDLVIPVKIIDCRRIWGRVDCLITPVGGNGQQWVEQSRIKIV